jgi:hypothetical protein
MAGKSIKKTPVKEQKGGRSMRILMGRPKKAEGQSGDTTPTRDR